MCVEAKFILKTQRPEHCLPKSGKGLEEAGMATGEPRGIEDPNIPLHGRKAAADNSRLNIAKELVRRILNVLNTKQEHVSEVIHTLIACI